MIGVDLSITNSSLTMIIAIVLIITAYKLSIERGYIVPTRIQSIVDILYETVYRLIKDNIGALRTGFNLKPEQGPKS